MAVGSVTWRRGIIARSMHTHGLTGASEVTQELEGRGRWEPPVQELFLTAEELYLWPDDGQRYELVRGTLVSMAATGGQHGIIASCLDYRLRAFVEAHDLGEVCAAETGFRLAQNPDTVRAPDVSLMGDTG